MNTSAKGAAYDNEVLAILRSHGYGVMRSAASKGAFDVHAWNDRKSGYFQDKSGRFSCAAAERLAQTLPWPHGATAVGVVHECRKGCRTTGHTPQRRCLHVASPLLGNADDDADDDGGTT